MKTLTDILARHKRGAAVGIYSLCTAHPWVIEAAMHEAKNTGTPLLIEATCNQVNQDGGYTGMKPADFREFAFAIADRAGLARERVWLGGDHLGPNVWQKESAETAMNRADELVSQYVAAGFRKIHLDCSMACADDPVPLPEALISARAARLATVAEYAWKKAGGEAPVYVIGTEVPVPGGAAEDLHELAVTSPHAAAATIETHRKAFAAAGLEAAWPRVIALVVQPGVEFDLHKVVDYRPDKAIELKTRIERDPQFVFEAHSTDYQTPENLAALVRDHFAILKVGPGATFALRETLWALAAIEAQLPGIAEPSRLPEVALRVMRENPKWWRGHYHAASSDQAANGALDLAFSLSDRIRYYWPDPAMTRACGKLLENLRSRPLPMTLISQYLPRQYDAIRANELDPSVDALLRNGVAQSLRPYIRACGS
jgi:D-tagatose-1,6-bisphosphate aldolase subunit GatZ/KbaZ